MKRWLEGTFPGGKWQSGGDYLVSSPLREDRHPSFAIHPEKRVWHDFATGEHGLLSELCKTLGIEEPGREGRAKALLIPPVDPEARQLWEKGVPASSHAYAERKGFPLDALKINPANGELLIPQRDPRDGSLIGVERIAAREPRSKDDKTKFQTGKRGGIFPIGSTDGEQPILISEGVSTGHALHRLTGWPVYVAFSAGQLAAMYQTVRFLHPGCEIAVAPDYDKAGHDNADKAAALGATVVQLPEGSQEKDDWLDIEQRHGIEIVKQMFRDQWATRRKKEKPAEKPKLTISTMTALELRRSAIKPPTWIVPNILPQGIGVLAGRPKGGKSWLALKLALSVASGTEFLGNDCKPGKVLYAALEDTPYRLKSRIGKLWDDDRTVPADLHATTDIPRLDAIGLPVLEAWVQEHRPRLVILDTWAKCKASGDSKKNAYEQDVEIVSRIKKLADDNECCVLLLHHENKQNGNDQNWLNSLSGSLGLPATVDTILSLKREMGADDAVLKRAGRDLTDDSDLALEWTEEGWRYQGLAKETKCGKERLLILRSLRDAGEPVSVTYISADIGKTANATRSLLFKMVKGGLVSKTSKGMYQLPQEGRFKDDDDDDEDAVTSVTDVNTVMPVTSVMPVMPVMQGMCDSTGAEEHNGITAGESTVMQHKPSDTNALDGKHNDHNGIPGCTDVTNITPITLITPITHKPGNLEKFNLPSLAEKESARQEFFALLDEGVEVDCLTGKPMSEFEVPPLCGPSLLWLESQPEAVKAFYQSELKRLHIIGVGDEEQRALRSAYAKYAEVSA